MNGNSINFDIKKIKIRDFYKDKNKKASNIDGIDVDKVLVSLLDIAIMILLGDYL